MSKHDKWIVAVLLLMTIGSAGVLFMPQQDGGEPYLSIQVENQRKQRYDLTENNTIELESKHGISRVEVVDGKVKMVEAICDDKICEKTGWISKGGQSIVCLPEQISIVVESKDIELDSIVQ